MKYAIQIAEALQEAHGKGIIHRDIKCENIMVNSKNQIKVMDFGLAKLKGSLKLTRTSSTVGTLAYMAPEQIQGGEVDARSDIFSYGIVVFEMLTGKTPFRGEHEAAVMYSILNEQPEQVSKYRSDISPEIERVINRSLEKDPEDRYQSIADMVSELRRELKKSGKVIRPASTTTTSGHSLPQEEKALPSPKVSSKRLSLIIGAVVISLLIVALVVYFFGAREQAIDSLAVLPFENVGGGPELDYLSDGVTESIINNLTKIQGLRVVPRSSAFRFKGKDADLQEVGSKLNVGAILTGKIVHRGGSLDVQVDLIDVKNESQLWGNRYQSDLNGVLSLQENITKEVSSKLGIGLTAASSEKLTRRATENTEAYQLYMQGRYYWNKRSATSIEQAISYFNQAIQLDPTYALAYSGLADCYILQPQYAGLSTKIALPLTQAAARKALSLDNTLAEPHTTLAFSYFQESRIDEAEAEFQQSLALNPRHATTYHWYGLMMSRMGKHERYLSLIQEAHKLDPYSPVITLNLGIAHLNLEHYEEALRYMNECTKIDPSFASGYAWTGLIYLKMKNFDRADPLLHKAVELSGRSSECLGYLGYFYGKTGKRIEALKLLKENEERYKAGTGAAYNIAKIYAGLGEKEKVFEFLELDYRDRSAFISSLSEDFMWGEVRSDPRFIDLERKVGLVK